MVEFGPQLLEQARAFALPYYGQSGRFYHNAVHVAEVLGALETRGVLTTELALAVWGHDLIYDPKAKDNEQRSADTFAAWLAEQGLDGASIARISAMILATRHTQPPASRAEALLVDADLSILAASPARFAAYEQAIRQEYAHVPALLYQLGRRKVLQGFWQRPQIYITPEFAGLEAGARANLAKSLKVLRLKR